MMEGGEDETILRKNSRYFESSEVSTFTRKAAFECIIPKVKVCDSYDIVTTSECKVLNDPCREPFIPPMTDLLKCQVELSQCNIDPAGDPKYSYVEYNYSGKLIRLNLC